MSQTRLAFWLIFFLPLTMPLYAAYDDDESSAIKKYVCWPNGDCYYGEYEDNERSGNGIYIWKNGDRYEGDFLEGQRDGSGVYIWANGDYYKGDYLENRRDGDGIYIWANGDRFEGDFANGKRDDGQLIRASEAPRSVPKPPTIKITAKRKRTRTYDRKRG
ncbi:MAG: hypothetical protein B6247_10605 [Candidatus Parabeggiatoa sp. nov. 2]|nr:MAG: hypothetical protein B6247_10605 [Beggiatoa sp. 4572_84]